MKIPCSTIPTLARIMAASSAGSTIRSKCAIQNEVALIGHTWFAVCPQTECQVRAKALDVIGQATPPKLHDLDRHRLVRAELCAQL